MNDKTKRRLQQLKEMEDAHKAAFPDGDNSGPDYTEAQIDALNNEMEMTYAKEDVFDDLREHIDAGDVGTLKALRENPTLNRLRNELLWLSEVKRGLAIFMTTKKALAAFKTLPGAVALIGVEWDDHVVVFRGTPEAAPLVKQFKFKQP